MRFNTKHQYDEFAETNITQAIESVYCPICKKKVEIGHGLHRWILHPNCYDKLMRKLEEWFDELL